MLHPAILIAAALLCQQPTTPLPPQPPSDPPTIPDKPERPREPDPFKPPLPSDPTTLPDNPGPSPKPAPEPEPPEADRKPDEPERSPDPKAAGPAVHAATSKDGLAWAEVPEPVLVGATAPDVLRLGRATPARHGPDAGVVLLYAVEAGAPGGGGLVRLLSTDDGRTWTGKESVAFVGLPEKQGTPAGPSAVQLDDGRVRLYFTLTPPPASSSPARTPSGFDRAPGAPGKVWSAVSNDGQMFVVEDGARLELSGLVDPEVVRSPEGHRPRDRADAAWLMFACRDGRTLLATSTDGLTWKRDEVFGVDGREPGAAPTATGVRLYLTGDAGVSSAAYDPATGKVTKDSGARVAGRARGAAVAQRMDTTWLLVFSRPPTKEADKPPSSPGR